jgi:hypothetical protein
MRHILVPVAPLTADSSDDKRDTVTKRNKDQHKRDQCMTMKSVYSLIALLAGCYGHHASVAAFKVAAIHRQQRKYVGLGRFACVATLDMARISLCFVLNAEPFPCRRPMFRAFPCFQFFGHPLRNATFKFYVP